MRLIKSSLGCLMLCLLLISPSERALSTDEIGWIRLGTFWDALGSISSISPRGDYTVITYDDTGISDDNPRRLVHISTGNVILEVEGGDIVFNDTGQFAIYYQFADEYPYVRQAHVLNLDTGHTYSVDGYIDNFNSNDQYMVSTQRIEGERNPISQLRAPATGEIIAEYTGAIVRFSRDRSVVVVSSIDETQRTMRVMDIAANEQVAAFTYPIPDMPYSHNAAFNVDDSLLALYFFPEEMQIIDTDTWTVLYTLIGSIIFSPDGRYIAHNNHAGYSDVQLIEAHTGRVLDEFLGSLSFSREGPYWIRGEALSYDLRLWQIIELDTGEVVFEATRYIVGPHLYDADTVVMWNIETQMTQFFDLQTQELVREIDGNVERFGEVMIVDMPTLPFDYLQSWETGETYAIGRQIEILPDNTLALVSNGLFVDVYGPARTDTAELPPPRPDEGIARIEPGEIVLYAAPDADNPRIITDSNMLNDTYIYVLGRSAQSGWLYVSFLLWGRNPEWIRGWIRSDGLEQVVSWETVPVLNADDPIANLRSIAFNIHP